MPDLNWPRTSTPQALRRPEVSDRKVTVFALVTAQELHCWTPCRRGDNCRTRPSTRQPRHRDGAVGLSHAHTSEEFTYPAFTCGRRHRGGLCFELSSHSPRRNPFQVRFRIHERLRRRFAHVRIGREVHHRGDPVLVNPRRTRGECSRCHRRSAPRRTAARDGAKDCRAPRRDVHRLQLFDDVRSDVAGAPSDQDRHRHSSGLTARPL
jgi:hypothetical protein